MLKKKIVIFGSNDHSKVVFSEIIKHKDYNIEGFVDDFCKKGKKIITYNNKNYYNLGTIKNFIKKEKDKKKREKKNYNNVLGIVGVGFGYIRRKIVKEILKLDKNFKWEKIISKDSVINGNFKVGEGSLIMSGVVINTQTKIGKHCIINTSSSIDHDNYFKDYSGCAPGVTTGVNVTVGENSYLGIGCVVKNGIKIGNNTVIGGKSFVNNKCDNNFVYYGLPAKKIKKRKDNENYLI